MKWFYYLFFLILLVIAALFAVDNNQAVTLNLGLFSFALTAPFYLWLWGALLLWVLICQLVQMLRQAGDVAIKRCQAKEIEALRNELDALKCEERIKESYQEVEKYEQA